VWFPVVLLALITGALFSLLFFASVLCAVSVVFVFFSVLSFVIFSTTVGFANYYAYLVLLLATLVLFYVCSSSSSTLSLSFSFSSFIHSGFSYYDFLYVCCFFFLTLPIFFCVKETNPIIFATFCFGRV
jgi:hypothetical protein